MSSRYFKLYRAYSNLFNSSNAGKFFWSWILKDYTKVQEKKKKSRCLRSSPRQNVRLGTFTLQKWSDGKEMYVKAWCTCKVVVFSNLNLLLFCCSRCRRRRRCLSSLMCRDRDNWCEKRADRTRPVRLACFLAWLVQAKLIFITGKKNCTIQVPPPNQRRTVQLKTVRTKFATSDTRGELGRVNFRKDFWDCY